MICQQSYNLLFQTNYIKASLKFYPKILKIEGIYREEYS